MLELIHLKIKFIWGSVKILVMKNNQLYNFIDVFT